MGSVPDGRVVTFKVSCSFRETGCARSVLFGSRRQDKMFSRHQGSGWMSWREQWDSNPRPLSRRGRGLFNPQRLSNRRPQPASPLSSENAGQHLALTAVGTSFRMNHNGENSPKVMAEREGFEPPIPVKVYTLSRRAPSATRPSLRAREFAIILSGQPI